MQHSSSGDSYDWVTYVSPDGRPFIRSRGGNKEDNAKYRREESHSTLRVIGERPWQPGDECPEVRLRRIGQKVNDALKVLGEIVPDGQRDDVGSG
jgi:hypothetical protein